MSLKMEPYTVDNGKRVKDMVEANSLGQMEAIMKGIGEIIKLKAKGDLFIQMEMFMKDNGV
jgi:hypothetical protein